MSPHLIGPHTPANYEIRVEGHLDEHWSTWFGGLALSHENDGTTTLRGVVTDQAELHGLLTKVRNLGATLISVVATDGPHSAGTEEHQHRHAPDARATNLPISRQDLITPQPPSKPSEQE